MPKGYVTTSISIKGEWFFTEITTIMSTKRVVEYIVVAGIVERQNSETSLASTAAGWWCSVETPVYCVIL